MNSLLYSFFSNWSFSITYKVMRHFLALLIVFLVFISLENANAQDRKISLHSINTGETLSIIYKKNGRYVSSAMSKLNYILRDWRKNEVKKIDPKLIDLLWELHRDLGSKKVINVISGYRSHKTNSQLRKARGGQARNSLHIKGMAVDVQFPDVPIRKLREMALMKQVGGVGYYPRSSRPFVHVDTGRVRHWPRMPAKQYAQLLNKGKKYKFNSSAILLASNNVSSFFNFNKSNSTSGSKATNKTVNNVKRKNPAKPSKALNHNIFVETALPKRPPKTLLIARANLNNNRIIPKNEPIDNIQVASAESVLKPKIYKLNKTENTNLHLASLNNSDPNNNEVSSNIIPVQLPAQANHKPSSKGDLKEHLINNLNKNNKNNKNIRNIFMTAGLIKKDINSNDFKFALPKNNISSENISNNGVQLAMNSEFYKNVISANPKAFNGTSDLGTIQISNAISQSLPANKNTNYKEVLTTASISNNVQKTNMEYDGRISKVVQNDQSQVANLGLYETIKSFITSLFN